MCLGGDIRCMCLEEPGAGYIIMPKRLREILAGTTAGKEAAGKEDIHVLHTITPIIREFVLVGHSTEMT